MPRTGRRTRWRWGIGAALVFLLLAPWVWWPEERLLLPRAIRIADAADFDGWASSKEYLQLSWPWPINAANLPTITRCNVHTGRTHSYPVTKAVRDSHSRILPSPDGRWALCWNGNGSTGDGVTAMNLRTGRSLTWPAAGDTYHYENLWMADSRRWVQATTLPDGYVTLFSLDRPAERVRLSLSSPGALKWKECAMTTQDRLLVYGEADETGASDPAQSPRSGWVIREYRLLPHVVRLRTLYVRPPAGQETAMPGFSPSGERIAWSCFEPTAPSRTAWLHRLFPWVPASPQARLSLWITRLDGSQAREIGHINVTPEEQSPGLLPRWLPDGRHLSFVYNDVLYTLPAD
jgi:hypothetical protein